VPTDAPYFSFNIIRNPNPDGIVSDEGVFFHLDVSRGDGKWQSVFSEFFNPSTHEDQLKPQPHIANLAKFAGQRILLRFSAGTGKKGVWPNEWIAWHHMQWQSADRQPARPLNLKESEKLIYDKDVKIYDMSPVLARTSVFHRARLVGNSHEVLAALRSDDFDPFKSIVINQEDLSDSQKQSLRPFTSGSGKPEIAALPATINVSTSREVDITLPAGLQSASLLLMTDTFYPGWRAFVDGNEVDVIKANYSFRAIVLPANASHVNFVYDPISYRLGSWLSLVTILGLIIVFSLEFLIMKRAAKLS
jgi:hypothetical protein